MRGNPLQQLVLITVAFLLLGIPVWRLTRTAPAGSSLEARGTETQAKAAIQSTPAAKGTTLEVTLDFAPAAAEFSLTYLDGTVLEGKDAAVATGKWQASLPSEGADLVLHVVWPAGWNGTSQQGAARVNVRFPDGHSTEKSFWSSGAAILDTVVTVPSRVTANGEKP